MLAPAGLGRAWRSRAASTRASCWPPPRARSGPATWSPSRPPRRPTCARSCSGRAPGRAPRRAPRRRRDARARRRRVRRATRGSAATSARRSSSLDGCAGRRASTAARRWSTAPTATTWATTVPACGRPPSAACAIRCSRPGSARTRCGACRARSACRRRTCRSRPASPRASPTASRSRRRSCAGRRGRAALRELGFRQCRVRHHGDVARIEVEPSELERAPARCARRSSRRLHALGFTYVTLDLHGFRSGSMNEA